MNYNITNKCTKLSLKGYRIQGNTTLPQTPLNTHKHIWQGLYALVHQFLCTSQLSSCWFSLTSQTDTQNQMGNSTCLLVQFIYLLPRPLSHYILMFQKHTVILEIFVPCKIFMWLFRLYLRKPQIFSMKISSKCTVQDLH